MQRACIEYAIKDSRRVGQQEEEQEEQAAVVSRPGSHPVKGKTHKLPAVGYRYSSSCLPAPCPLPAAYYRAMELVEAAA